MKINDINIGAYELPELVVKARFRWDITPQWAYRYFFQSGMTHNVVNEVGSIRQVRPESVCRFTGFYDKDGQPIFDKDIIAFKKEDGYHFMPAEIGIIVKEFRDKTYNILNCVYFEDAPEGLDGDTIANLPKTKQPEGDTDFVCIHDAELIGHCFDFAEDRLNQILKSVMTEDELNGWKRARA